MPRESWKFCAAKFSIILMMNLKHTNLFLPIYLGWLCMCIKCMCSKLRLEHSHNYLRAFIVSTNTRKRQWTINAAKCNIITSQTKQNWSTTECIEAFTLNVTNKKECNTMSRSPSGVTRRQFTLTSCCNRCFCGALIATLKSCNTVKCWFFHCNLKHNNVIKFHSRFGNENGIHCTTWGVSKYCITNSSQCWKNEEILQRTQL